MTSQTSSAFVRTLLSHAFSIEDLHSEGYDFVLTSRFQSDPLGRRYAKYRSGRKFSIGLKDDILSEKIIKIKSLLEEGIDIDENLEVTDEGDVQKLEHLLHDVDTLTYTTDTISRSENSREVAVHMAGYVSKNLKKRMGKCCNNFLIEEFFSDKNSDFLYIKNFSRGGLMISSMNLANYVCTAFAILDFTVTVILKSSLGYRIAAEHVLLYILNLFESVTCKERK